jgi:hypothetical protein
MKATKQTTKWEKVAAGHYRNGTWTAFEVKRGWWELYRYGEEVKGCGGCTLKRIKRIVEILEAN